MIRVYLWKPEGPNVGHLSMKLSDGTYISFWPKDGFDTKFEGIAHKQDSAAMSYRGDVRSEGREADEVLDLPDDIVDQGKIKSWWSGYVDQNKYHLLMNNCALVVQQALLVGGIFQSNRLGYECDTLVTPSEVFRWIQRCKELYPQKQDNSIAAQMFRGAYDYFKS